MFTTPAAVSGSLHSVEVYESKSSTLLVTMVTKECCLPLRNFSSPFQMYLQQALQGYSDILKSTPFDVESVQRHGMYARTSSIDPFWCQSVHACMQYYIRTYIQASSTYICMYIFIVSILCTVYTYTYTKWIMAIFAGFLQRWLPCGCVSGHGMQQHRPSNMARNWDWSHSFNPVSMWHNGSAYWQAYGKQNMWRQLH